MILGIYTAKLLLHCHDWILFIGFGKNQLLCSLTPISKFWAPRLVRLNRALCFTYKLNAEMLLCSIQFWNSTSLTYLMQESPMHFLRHSFAGSQTVIHNLKAFGQEHNRRPLKRKKCIQVTQHELLTIKNYMCYFMTLHELLLSSHFHTRTFGVTT